MTTDLFGLEINVWADSAIRLILITLVMTVFVMMLIWAERKVLARFQQRIGPQKTGPIGLLQSLADAVKLVGKEDLRPKAADPWTFELAPFLVFIPVFMGFVIVPFLMDWNIKILELGLLYFVAVSSINIVGWVMAGWGSDNRYAMIGGLRAAAQSISYELPLVLTILAVGMFANTFNIDEIIRQQDAVPYIVWQPLTFLIFFIAALAEMNRSPFDIPVGESEMVGGPFVEYSGIRWSMFMLAEYAALFIMAILASAIFLGGYIWPFGEELGRGFQLLLVGAKASAFIFLVFLVRAAVPRLRIDQLMAYSWKVLLPLALLQILVNGLVLVNGWSESILAVTGVLGVVALFVITARSVSKPGAVVVRRSAMAGSEAA